MSSNKIETKDVGADGPDALDALDIQKGEIAQIGAEKLDEAELFLRENDHTWAEVEVLLADKVKMAALVKKIDWNLLPLLMVTYGLQLIDKTTLGSAAVFNLADETHLVGNQYAWVSSVFYFGYMFWEYPGSYLAQHFRVGRYCSFVVIVWGAVLMATAAASNYAGLIVCRFLLGCLEAPITPCFMLIVSSWYDRQAQPFRAGLFYCCNGIGAILGSLLMYGIGQINGFYVYRAIFLICGGLTFVWGFVLLWKLPNDVLTAKNYSMEEKLMVIGIGRRNQTGVYNHRIKWYQIREAFLDPQLWLGFFIMVLNETVNGGFVSFGALIIKSLVDSALKTTALGIPQGAFTATFIITGTYCASRFKNCRCIVMAVYLIPSILASFLDLYLPRSHLVGLLFAYYMMSSYCATLTLVLQMPSYNLSGYTKRVTGGAFVFLGYCVGNVIGPHAFVASEAPAYPSGCKTLIACNTIQLGLIAALRILLQRRNKKRDQMNGVINSMEMVAEDKPLVDITDFEDPDFRYQY